MLLCFRGDAGCRCDAESGASFIRAGGDAEEKENFQNQKQWCRTNVSFEPRGTKYFQKKGGKGTKQGRVNHRCFIRSGDGKKVRRS